MKKRITAFLILISLIHVSIHAQQKKEKSFFGDIFKTKNASIYTNIELSGGFNSDSKTNCPIAKLKIDIAEGVFSNLSIQSSASVSAGYSKGDDIYILGVSIPDLSFGYYFSNFLVYGGGSFYQCWYFINENTNYESFLVSTHCYGYTLHAGISYAINDYISLFSEYTFAPHNWMMTTGHSDMEWIYSNQFTAGVSFSVPWSL